MASFSERHGYQPDRSRLHQVGQMDGRLRNAIWNFLSEHYLGSGDALRPNAMLLTLWTKVAGKPADELEILPMKRFRPWYFKASWNEVYDVLECCLQWGQQEQNITAANAILAREGSGYRFVAGVIMPIVNDEELAEVEAVVEHVGPFDAASEHIKQAVRLFRDRDNPDYRNAIKESISAVESAVRVASEDPKADIEKGLQKLAVHSQLKQAWSNLYNWTSDESGVRHAMKGTPQVGLGEARYMIVASLAFFALICSAFINYLVERDQS